MSFAVRAVPLCQGGDSNPYGFLHQILSLARLPISPPWRWISDFKFSVCDCKERRFSQPANAARDSYLDCDNVGGASKDNAAACYAGVVFVAAAFAAAAFAAASAAAFFFASAAAAASARFLSTPAASTG